MTCVRPSVSYTILCYFVLSCVMRCLHEVTVDARSVASPRVNPPVTFVSLGTKSCRRHWIQRLSICKTGLWSLKVNGQFWGLSAIGSVCISVRKTAEPIVMPFAGRIPVSLRNNVIDMVKFGRIHSQTRWASRRRYSFLSKCFVRTLVWLLKTLS